MLPQLLPMTEAAWSPGCLSDVGSGSSVSLRSPFMRSVGSSVGYTEIDTTTMTPNSGGGARGGKDRGCAPSRGAGPSSALHLPELS